MMDYRGMIKMIYLVENNLDLIILDYRRKNYNINKKFITKKI